jgi:uncharacterized protein (TIGR02145 family)
MKKYFILVTICLISSCSCQRNDPEILIQVFDVSDITHCSAILKADAIIITPGMSIFEKGVCISETHDPTVSADSPVGGINTPGEYTTYISGLKPDTKYYARAFVHTDLGFCYSEGISFNTLPVNKVIDNRDGQKYYCIEYRDNTWMVENLNYKMDGSYYFNNDSIKYASEYGRLYSYEAAKNACPDGWRLPGDLDWKLLETELGMELSEVSLEGPRGSIQGSLLKEPGNRLWTDFSDITFSSGFTAKPAGSLNTLTAEFSNGGETGYMTAYWTDDEASAYSYIRVIQAHLESITRIPVQTSASAAYSVRCIKIK